MRRLIRIIRNILLLAIAVIVILAGVLAFNTFTHGSRQLQVAAVPRADGRRSRRGQAAGRSDPLPDHFELSKSPTRTPKRCAACRRISKRAFRRFMPRPNAKSSAATACSTHGQGSDPKAQPIALLAHQDVVPVAPGTEKDWQQPPFDGVIADGFIWGRGSWDDKGNLYSMLEAAEAMAKAGFRPKRTIYFAFGHDEETAGTAGAKIDRGAAGLARRPPRLRARRGPVDHRRHHEGPRQAGRADRRRRKGLCDAGAERAG